MVTGSQECEQYGEYTCHGKKEVPGFQAAQNEHIATLGMPLPVRFGYNVENYRYSIAARFPLKCRDPPSSFQASSVSLPDMALLKMKQAEFIALSACSMMLTALGIDIMLPAFGALREHFELAPDSTAPSRVIVFFFLGQIAQLLFGVLSDRFGRVPILRVGFPLYIVGGVAAAFAPTMGWIYVARFIAGMGASAVFMTTIAGVRDRFSGDDMARTMSLILTIFLFTPIVAPFLGLTILSFSSWQMVFLTPPIFAFLIFMWSFRMEESHPAEKRIQLQWDTIRRSVMLVLSNRTFLRYTTVTTLLFSALSSYVASSEHIIGEIFDRPSLFAWVFAGIGLLMSIGSFINSKLSAKFGARTAVRWLLAVYTTVAGILLLLTSVSGNPPQLVLFFSSVAILMAINLAVEPNSSALALEPMGDVAGMASAVYGTLFFFIGASAGAVISALMEKSVLPLVISFFTIGLLAIVLVFGDRTKIKNA